jgi:MFS family permease
MRRFSRNAKLYLAYATLSGVNSSIFLVAFAFYLEELFNPGGADPGATVTFLGVPMLVPAFIGFAFGAQAVAHGANSLPSGLIGDKYGRKRSFIAASLLAVFAGVAILVTSQPVFLVVLAVIVGIGEAFHGVVGAPFLMENSAPEERMHLFTLSGILSTVSAVAGAFLGGVLPGLFESWILTANPGLGPIAGGTPLATALRLTLFMALPFGLIELIPLALMKESFARVTSRLRDVLAMKHVTHKPTVIRLFAVSGLYAAGLGLYFPLLNLHFEHEFHIHAEEFGPIVALNEIGIAAAILLVPFLVGRLGKVRTIAATRLASVPFLLALAFAGDVYLATVLFVLRGALSSLAFPVAGAFSMEVVDAPERATTAGFTHAAFDIAYGSTIVVGGLLLAAGGFWVGFVMAASLYVLHAALWYRYFRGHPVELASRLPAVAGGST